MLTSWEQRQHRSILRDRQNAPDYGATPAARVPNVARGVFVTHEVNDILWELLGRQLLSQKPVEGLPGVADDLDCPLDLLWIR